MRRAAVALALVLAVVVAGCGGGDDDDANSSDQSDVSDQTDEQPAGEVIFEDTFENNEHGWLSPEAAGPDETGTETIVDREGVTVTLDDGLTYATTGQSDLGVYLQWPNELTEDAETITDVRLEAEAHAVAPGSPGLACRITDLESEAPSYYELGLSSAGAYQINETHPDGTVAVLAANPPELLEQLNDDSNAPLEFEPAFEFEDDRVYELAAECTGGEAGRPVQLTLFVDGDEVLSVEDEDDPIPSGVAGLTPGTSSTAQQETGPRAYEVVYERFTIIDLGG